MAKVTDIIKQVSGASNLYENPTEVEMWQSWYKGYVADFHSYDVYNGKATIKCRRLSLQLAKRVCEDWANLLVNEKTDIALDNQQAQERLYKVLDDLKFWRKANVGVEKSFALGMGALVLSVDDITVDGDGVAKEDGKIGLQFVTRDKMIPITVTAGEITECAFVSKDTNYTYISVHLIDKATGNYVIHNIIGTGNGDNVGFDLQNPGQYWVFNTKSPLPWFFIFKPNIADNIDINSPFGISVFANSIDVMKTADIIFDSYSTEFLLGRKRVFVAAPPQMIDTATGEMRPTFDSRDLVYYNLPETADGEPFIKETAGELRVDAHNNAIQNVLNLLSYNCGFGTNHYRFDGGSIATATQVISENSDMFRTLKKHEILLDEVLKQFFATLVYALNTFTDIKVGHVDNIEIRFDDSIIEDKAAERAQDRQDVQMGAMTLVEYRMKWYNEDKETAEANVAELYKYALEE